jgi:Tfp pilus assembly protein PilF
MKRVSLPSVAARIMLPALAIFLGASAAADCALLGNQFSLNAQSSAPKPGPQTKIQKVANPLNDLLKEAQLAIDNNNFEAAIVPLQKVIAEQPESAYAHFQLAYVYTALKRTDEARAEYARTIAIDPKMSEAYLNLGMMLLDKQEAAAAVAPLQKAVELLPAQSRPRYLLAVALDRSGERAAAADSFEALLHLDPNDITAINYLGMRALRPMGAGALRKAWTPRKSRRPPLPRTAIISNSSPATPRPVPG